MIKDLSKFSFLLFLSLTLVMTSCDDDDDEEPTPTPSGPTQNIAELAIASPQFSTLVAALQATNLVDAVSADGPMTVFAPNNEAFDAYFVSQGLPAGSTIDDVLASPDFDEETVRQLLLYHVIGSEIPAAAVTAKTYVQTSSTSSPSGDELSLLAEPANMTVWVNGGSGKGAAVINADIFATNGVIHEIDGVLELPDVVDHAIFNSNLSELVDNVIQADLVDALRMGSEFTVFAPDNQAFFDIESIVEGLSDQELANVLLYHVLPVQVRASGITDGDQTTLFSGQTIELALGADANDVPVVTIVDASPTTEISTVTTTDIQGTNGVVHVIDGVLVPEL